MLSQTRRPSVPLLLQIAKEFLRCSCVISAVASGRGCQRGRGDMIKGTIGRSQDVPVVHVKLSHSNNRMWGRLSSCLGLYRFYRLRRSSNRTCDPEAPHRQARKVSGFTVDCFSFLGDTSHAGDLRFILRWAKITAVLSLDLSCLFFY